MTCPQCSTRLQSERSATPDGSYGKMLETRHYRCEECDTEYVRTNRGSLQKIDGGSVPLDAKEMATVTEGIEE